MEHLDDDDARLRKIRANLRLTPAQHTDLTELARRKYEGNLSQATRVVIEAGLRELGLRE